ncbi:helix-turn-helix domain-containing protein [Cuneatibacter caecimuris]|uniref:Helix-turn-helix protein n=1 Tax=Cuneatibacter caecimuris TaxID=1796618 RepID=A0A4Q7PPN1_9FIRM|nr:helix-turn-helix domain-containing protein [Cuneatibacter caecimuris]RZT02979.1 helix-turn-helix protein [Cuneatibacter caecimuris]
METREFLRKLREQTGMNRRQFAEYFDIPYRTVQEWELGNRRMPDYLLRLMVYKLKTERLIEEGAEERNQGA